MASNSQQSDSSLQPNNAALDKVHSYSSDSSVAGSEEFYDAIGDDNEIALTGDGSTCTPSVNSTPSGSTKLQLAAIPSTSHLMADSGIFSMHSSHVDPLTASDAAKDGAVASSLLNDKTISQRELTNFDNELQTINKTTNEAMPRPPPRTRKKKGPLLKQNSVAGDASTSNDNNGNNSSSADSRSMTNSVESTTTSVGPNLQVGHNLTSILDEIVSIKGDLSITEVDDKRSVYLDEHLLNRHFNLKNCQGLAKHELIFSNEQLKEISKNLIFTADKHDTNQTAETSNSNRGSSSKPPETGEVLNQIMIMNIDTGEKVPLGKAENILPKCLNPLSLHLMKLTNDYNENDAKSDSLEKESSSSNIADTTFKSVTSLISSTISDIKSEIRDKSLDKKAKKKLKELQTDETKQELPEYEDDDDEDDDEDKNGAQYKDGKIRSKFQAVKKLGSGFIRGVKGVKERGKERSTFHVDLKSYSGEPEPPPPPPRYKLKVNHKRGGADFDGLRLVQEINDCRGAIWCMKFSNCSQLLAAAGQDHMLRVYCAQKSWKYFTQLRNKASGQHISPNSTKERSSANGDSFGRLHRSSFSRSGSLNASDNNSHNNSSSSSSSSAFAKEMYKDEDNTLSEEGPLLLFTIYRGHTADVLDLAWSKNHFLLSASMDKTVRLWHITRIECLCTFRHIDFVTTIQFHPRDDRYFLSGSLDGKLRLWNIPDKRVTLWNEVNALPVQRGSGGSNSATESDMSPTHGLITASSFVQNGKFAVVGTYDGRIIFYTTDQLKYFTQIHVSAKSVSATGSSQSGSSHKIRINKVTGIESVDDNNKILVTTNDSRLRLYDLRDLSLTCKYKGCINQSSQIKAAISHDHKYIICGSENNSFYIWRIQDNLTIGQRRDRNKQYECIRLLNPPSPASITSPIFTNESTAASTVAGATTDASIPVTTLVHSKVVEKERPLLDIENTLDSATTTTAAITSPLAKDNSAATSLNPAGSNIVIPNQQQQQAQSYSSAATKIVTSAIFAPVPGQIDDKGKYVIAISDFNGYIRIFSKH